MTLLSDSTVCPGKYSFSPFAVVVVSGALFALFLPSVKHQTFPRPVYVNRGFQTFSIKIAQFFAHFFHLICLWCGVVVTSCHISVSCIFQVILGTMVQQLEVSRDNMAAKFAQVIAPVQVVLFFPPVWSQNTLLLSHGFFTNVLNCAPVPHFKIISIPCWPTSTRVHPVIFAGTSFLSEPWMILILRFSLSACADPPPVSTLGGTAEEMGGVGLSPRD